jgi:NADH-quinone oxidoreductase subunit G
LRQALFAEFPYLAAIDVVPTNKVKAIKPTALKGKAFTNAVADHYLTNPIARASEVMAELSANAKARRETPIAAE